MSVKIMSQVWANGPSDQAQLLVLLAMADIAGDDGKLWPSVATIAEKARMSERNARRIIRCLEADGWVETFVNRGRNSTSKYFVKPDKITGQNNRTDCPGGQNEPENRTKSTVKPDTAMSPEPSRTIKNHHNMVEGKKTTPKEPRQNLDEGFDEFWAVYPKKVAKPDALKNWRKAIKDGATASQIIEGARRYAASETVRNGYVKNPQGWLSSHRWEDEPATPVSTAPVDQNSAWLRKVAGRH